VAGGFQVLKQKLPLRGLPAPFGTVQDNELGLRHLGKHGSEIETG
jgi:hypothetical protein